MGLLHLPPLRGTPEHGGQVMYIQLAIGWPFRLGLHWHRRITDTCWCRWHVMLKLGPIEFECFRVMR